MRRFFTDRRLRRRDALGLLAVPFLGAMAFKGRAAAADHAEAVLADVPSRTAPTGRTFVSPPECYFTYPHSNGFLPGGNPVLGQIGDDGQTLVYVEWDFRTGETRPLFRTITRNMYWDVAGRGGDIVAMQNRGTIVAVPTRGPGKPETILRIHATPSSRLEDLVSVNAAGGKVLYAIEKSDNDPRNIQAAELFELDRGTGAATSLCELPFDADHEHYCPFDETWIGFAHEGNIRQSLDRVWGLNRGTNAGRPQRLWDEVLADHDVGYVGHERWAFHRAGAFAVAFVTSPGRPRGLYFVDAATRTASLISASDYDWHCNASRDGQWAVVDTMAPRRRKFEDDGRVISDVVLIHVPTGRRSWLARSHMRPYHPWHPHPHFSPDGRFVIYNDYQRDGAGTPSRTVMLELALR